GGESGTLQIEDKSAALGESIRHFTLDNGAVGNAPGTRDIHRDSRAVGTVGTETADYELTLRQRVYLTVRTFKCSHQQCAAAKAFRVTHRRHGDIDGLSGLDERRQAGVNADGGDVLQLEVGAGRNHDAELLEHIAERLRREWRLRGLVAGTAETDDKAVADQRIRSHPR